MGKDTTTVLEQEAIANGSSYPANRETLKREFDELNSSAEEQARLIGPACKALNQAWDDLLPLLTKMQALLSQRGHERDRFEEPDLPTWSEWFGSFSKKTGLNLNIRTVQRRLKNFRSITNGQPAEGTRKQDTPKVQLSPAQQKQLLTKLQCANELVNALKAGADYTNLMSEFLAFGIDSERIGLWIENIRTGDHAQDTMRPSTQVATPNVVAGLKAGQHPTLPLVPSIMPKPGDSSGLFNVVNDTCGKQIRFTLEGLPPEMMADVFGQFARRLAAMHCQYDRTEGEIIVSVKYVSARPFMKAAALTGELCGPVTSYSV